MPATQTQFEPNPNPPGTRDTTHSRASLNAWRHHLTGQVATMPDEDRRAFETFTVELRQSYHPEGALELQIAQSIAEDEWRLNRARAIEHNAIALGHSGAAGEVATDHPQIHAAMTQARVFWRDPEKFALLTLYEQRISRKIQRSEARLRALQAERQAAFDQAVEEARLLAELAQSKGEIHHPETDPPAVNGFVFSAAAIARALDRNRRLYAARALAPPPLPRPRAAAASRPRAAWR